MQGQLWDAGNVRVSPRRQRRHDPNQKDRDRAKVLSGGNRKRMLARRAAAKGMSVPQYEKWMRLRRELADAKKRIAAVRIPFAKTCAECGRAFKTHYSRQILCGRDECKRLYGNRYTSASITRRYHSDPEFRDKVIATEQARRAEKLGMGSRKIAIGYLLERDKWRCGICGKKIRKREDASLDHIVPLSRGGEHVLENAQAAHKRCNYAKGNRGGGEQLLIVG